MLGAWSSNILVVETTRRFEPHAVRVGIPRLAYGIAVAAFAIVMVLGVFDPTSISLANLRAADVGWIPFEAAWRSSMGRAAADAMGNLVAYATLVVFME